MASSGHCAAKCGVDLLLVVVRHERLVLATGIIFVTALSEVFAVLALDLLLLLNVNGRRGCERAY
jgi:hypothetical protein